MYTNYVVQTILDHGPPETVKAMWIMVTPIIDRVRATPAGRRIYNKFQARQPEHDELQQSLGPVNGGFYPQQTIGWMPQTPHFGGNNQQPAFF
jgi:hypothetical protein